MASVGYFVLIDTTKKLFSETSEYSTWSGMIYFYWSYISSSFIEYLPQTPAEDNCEVQGSAKQVQKNSKMLILGNKYMNDSWASILFWWKGVNTTIGIKNH